MTELTRNAVDRELAEARRRIEELERMVSFRLGDIVEHISGWRAVVVKEEDDEKLLKVRYLQGDLAGTMARFHSHVFLVVDPGVASPEELAGMFGVSDPAEISDDLQSEYEDWMEHELAGCDNCGRGEDAHYETSREDTYGREYDAWVCWPGDPAGRGEGPTKEQLAHFAAHGCSDLLPTSGLVLPIRFCEGCGHDLPAVTS